MSEYQPLRSNDGNSESSQPERPGAEGDWKANMAELGKKFSEGVTVVGGKLTEGVGVMGERMKEMFQQPTLGEKLADEATAEILIGPDWDKNLQICDLINSGGVVRLDVVRGIKRRLALKNGHVQLLALTLLETTLKNCANMFPEVAGEKVLDAMVRLVDDPTSPVALREKALRLIEAWGESTDELRYLPVFSETYKSLKNRGIVFPPRDAESLAPIFTPPASYAAATAAPRGAGGYLPPPAVDQGVPVGVLAHGGADGLPVPGVSQVATPEGPVTILDSKEILSVARNSTELLSTVLTSAPPEEVLKDEVTLSLAAQCRMSKMSVQRLVESETSNETLLFEALTLNDELDKVLEKLAELQRQVGSTPAAETTGVPVAAQPSSQMADLLAPAPPVTAFAVPSGEPEADGGETLVRRRPGDIGGAPQVSEDEKALAELDAMVFGEPMGVAAASAQGAATSAGAAAASAGGAGAASSTQGQEGSKKAKEDDLIVF